MLKCLRKSILGGVNFQRSTLKILGSHQQTTLHRTALHFWEGRMRDDPNLKIHSSDSGHKGDGARKPTPTDPDIRAIKSLVEMDDSQKASGLSAPARAKDYLQSLKRAAQAPIQSRQYKSYAQWLRELAEAFFRRPDAPRILSILLLLTVFLLKPGLVVFMAFMALLIGLVLFFSFGPDRVQNWVIYRYHRLRERDAEAAERIRQRAAAASKRLSAIVEKLPERWTAGLYLPDFEEPTELPEHWETDPFERLAKQ